MGQAARRQRRRRGALAAGLLAASVALPGMGFPLDGFERRSERLESALREAIVEQRFDEVVDFGPVEGACPGSSWCAKPAARIAHVPNIDLAVIALDRRGRPSAVADVLLSRDHPDGIGVPVTDDLGADAVRWRRWNPARWNGGTFSEADGSRTTTVGWRDDPALTGDDDIVPGREQAPIEFMAPYPASTFKLLVAFQTLRLVDRHTLDLDGPYTYAPPGAPPVTRTTAELLDKMLTESDNDSAKALLEQLHDRGEVDSLNRFLAGLGLGTLQVNGTDPATGGRWGVGKITMTSLDAARLLLIVDGAPGVLWRAPDGSAVTADVLRPESRRRFSDLLGDQGWNDILTTANWCGAGYPAPGIPSRVAQRWVDPDSGTVTVGGKRFGADVRPCNDGAEVSFAHKTGFTYSYLADGGIVRPLRGWRGSYIVVMMSNLGYRYADARQADVEKPVCGDDPSQAEEPAVCYTDKLARLGAAVDDILRGR